jgi:hypothetical protein
LTTQILKGERGVALLMTMGVLSLVLLLSIAFIYSTQLAEKKVQDYKNLTKGRFLAKTGFKMAYDFLATEFANPNLPENLFPATKRDVLESCKSPFSSNSNWDGRTYWVSIHDVQGQPDITGIDTALHITIAGLNFTPEISFAGSATVSDSFSWTNIYDSTNQYPNNDTPIVGRISYLIIDESGKLDPSSICGSDVEGLETRIGKNADEINLKNVIEASLATKFQPYSNGGLLAVGSKWLSYYYIMKEFVVDDANVWTNSNLQSVVRNIFPFSYDIEAFYDGKEDKHRFNLARTDWDSDTMTLDLMLSDATNYQTEGNTGGIPWLGLSAIGTETDTDLKKQVIANLIDYSDSDSDATTDYPGSNPPTYLGNERTPYMNEFAFTAQIDGVSVLTIELYPELVNIYSESVGSGGTLTVNVRVASGDLDTNPTDLVYTWTSLPSAAPKSYYLPTKISQTVAYTPSGGMLSQLAVTILSAKYEHSSGGVWDFAYTNISPQEDLVFPTSALAYINVEINDPRHNLDPGEWLWTADWSIALDTLGVINSICIPNPGGDKDTESGAIEPWDVSTAYIRNGPIQTLWELGAIHRGAQWETINLGKYKHFNLPRIPTAHMSDYSDGDANILSQVKLGSDTEILGRININTANENVLKGLLQGITIGATYDNPGSGISLDDIDANAILGMGIVNDGDGTIREKNGSGTDSGGSTVGSAFRLRAQVATADRITLSDTTVLAGLNMTNVLDKITDAKKEETIAKIANLITVRQNYFTVIVVAQVIRDMITGYKNGTQGVFDSQADRIMTEQKAIAVIYRDALTNEFTVVRYENLDE